MTTPTNAPSTGVEPCSTCPIHTWQAIRAGLGPVTLQRTPPEEPESVPEPQGGVLPPWAQRKITQLEDRVEVLQEQVRRLRAERNAA